MVNIQSATSENRRGKKKKEETTAVKYNDRICYAGGHNQLVSNNELLALSPSY